MKPAIGLLCIVLALTLAVATRAQTVGVPAVPSVSYMNAGRYLVFQGNYMNNKGTMETGLVKYDSQTGLTWLLRPAPMTNDIAVAGFVWVPVKN